MPAVMILALIDQRIGRRNLARFAVDKELEALVQLLWYLRMQKPQPDSAQNAAPQ